MRTARMTAASWLLAVLMLGAGCAALPPLFVAGALSPCAVDMPNGQTPPGEAASPNHYGNGRMWTVLWPAGLVEVQPAQVRPDGRLGMKWPWWRGVVGELVVTGRRLDAQAPPLEAKIPEGYDGTGFQPSALIFPTEGCWEITGHAGGASLTFVQRVVRAEP